MEQVILNEGNFAHVSQSYERLRTDSIELVHCTCEA